MSDNWAVNIADLNQHVATLLRVPQLEPAQRDAIFEIVTRQFDGEVTPDGLLQAVQQANDNVSDASGGDGGADLEALGLRYVVFEAVNDAFVRDAGVAGALDRLRLAYEHLVGFQAGLRDVEPAAVTFALPTAAVIDRMRRAVGSGDGDSASGPLPARVRRTVAAHPVALGSAPATVAPPPPDFHSIEAIQGRLENSGRAGSMPNWRDLITVTEERGEGGERVIVYTANTHESGKPGRYSDRIFREFFLGRTPRMAKAADAAVDAGDEAAFDRIIALWGGEMVEMGQMQVRVRGYEKLEPGKIYQFAPTHNSQVEFPLLVLVLNGFSTGFVARRVFQYIPFIGSVMKKSPRFFFIDRERKGRARDLMDQVGVQLASSENSASVITFPQGTRGLERRDRNGNRIDPDLFAKGPLKKGAAHAALKTVMKGTPIEIVPITIMGVGRIKPKGRGTPVLTNQVVEVIIGDPIDPARFQVTETPAGERGPYFTDTQRDGEVVSKYEAAKRLTDEIEAVYRRDYKAPLMPPVLVRNPKAKENSWKPALSDLGSPNLEYLDGLRRIAVAPGQPVVKGEDAALVRRVEYASLARVVLNRWLDPFREAFLYLDLGHDQFVDVGGEQQNIFENYCRENGLNPEVVRNVRSWISEEELRGVYARAGINLNDPLVTDPVGATGREFADARDTTQAMRSQRAGVWVVHNAVGRFLDRFSRGDRAKKLVPKVVYHDPDPAQPKREVTSGQLRHVHHASHEGDYVRVRELLANQLAFQSEDFQKEGWQPFLGRLAAVQRPWNEAVADYYDRHEKSEHPGDEAVSEAALRVHRAILESGAFPEVSADLRIYAFYVYQARNEYQHLKGADDPELVEYARRRYFGLLGRGIKYQVLNELNRRLGGDPANRGLADVLRAVAKRKDLVPLRDRAFRAEYVATLIKWNQTLRGRLAEVDQKMAELGKKLGPVRRKIHETSLSRLSFSYTALQYHRLYRERGHITALLDAYGDIDLKEVLGKISGEFRLSLNPMPTEGDDDGRMPKAVETAWRDYLRARGEWAWDYDIHFRGWVALEVELYQRSFETEFEMNKVEGEMQVARYEDLMAQLRKDKGPLSINEEMRYAQALSDYRLKFADYLAAAENMTHGVDARVREPARKKKEVDLFFAMLRLHWAVTDLYKANGHEHAGLIKPISAMFPNQVEALNNIGSKDLEGLRPILESITYEQIVNLYFEVLLAGSDPRRLDRIMGGVGMQATAQGVSQVSIYGARVLAGELGQSSGADLFLNGASVLASDQATEFGVVPNEVIFSPNHQGFSDYTFIVAFLASLGLGRPWVTYDAKNFDSMPLYGAALSAGDGMGFVRDEGGTGALQRGMRDGVSRGVSPITFDHGTRRTTTTVSPLAKPGVGAFVPRQYVLGGSKGEAGVAARDAGVSFVPVYQGLGFNIDPDFGLSGNLGGKNFKEPWPIHAGTRLGGEGVIAFGDRIPAWVLPKTEDDLENLRLMTDESRGRFADLKAEEARLIEEGSDKRPYTAAVDRLCRLAIAAHTEFGRLRASFKPLRHLAENGAPSPSGSPSGGGGGVNVRDLARRGAVQFVRASPVSAGSRVVSGRKGEIGSVAGGRLVARGAASPSVLRNRAVDRSPEMMRLGGLTRVIGLDDLFMKIQREGVTFETLVEEGKRVVMSQYPRLDVGVLREIDSAYFALAALTERSEETAAWTAFRRRFTDEIERARGASLAVPGLPTVGPAYQPANPVPIPIGR